MDLRLLCGPNALLTPAEKKARLEWLENSRAREAQLTEIAGTGQHGYAEGPGIQSAVVTALDRGPSVEPHRRRKS